MSVKRGDVILVYVPNVGGPGGKVRPALVVQSDHNNTRLNETIIATITSNTSRVREATQLLIEVATPDGAISGLLHDSAVRCERLHSIPQVDVRRVIGKLSDVLMRQIDDCLKAALGLP
jgi:mRNA-degrading endonuclease toxin of MazEF toxin-antitoxin module